MLDDTDVSRIVTIAESNRERCIHCVVVLVEIDLFADNLRTFVGPLNEISITRVGCFIQHERMEMSVVKIEIRLEVLCET